MFFKKALTKIIISIFKNKYNIYFLQNNTKQRFQCKYLYVQTILYLIQNNTKQKILVFKAQDLYSHKLIFCKWANLQKPRYKMKLRMKS